MTTEQALDALAACSPDIEVIGVTDYFTTRSFRRAYEAWTAGAGAGITYLFPNVELRLNDATARGNGVNLHVMSAPEDVDLLDELLGKLTFSYKDHDFTASDAHLIALGRAYKGQDTLDETAARSEGARQFKVAFDEIRKLFQRDARYRERCLVAVAAGQDGTSGMRSADGGFDAYRQGLERFAQAIFSSNEKDRAFWLGRGLRTPSEIESQYDALKVCLHGSDAHEAARLGRPDRDRYTWLKGDPSFHTLRHACLAPDRRAHIGPSDPSSGQFGRITAVTINDDGWFTDGTVPLNTGLVAIIGPRGSGKTALADLVAVGAGSTQPFSNDSAFVHRAGALLQGSRATVRWFQDDDTTHSLASPVDPDAFPRRVRYLSQQFVERLCASDGVRPELLREIERVIFEAWPVERRQGATSFQELLDIRLGSARTAQYDELAAVTRLSEAITAEHVTKRDLAKKVEQRAADIKTITALEGQIKALTSQANSASGERHGVVSTALAARQRTLQTVDRCHTDLNGLTVAVETARTSAFPAFLSQLRKQYPNSGLTEEQWQLFLPTFSGDVNATVATALTTAESLYSAIAGDPATVDSASVLDSLDAYALASRTVAELTAEQARLEQLVGLDRTRASKLTQLQQQLAKVQASASRLADEITNANQADVRIATFTAERAAHYRAYFNALLHEEDELRALYAPLDELLKKRGSTVAKLTLSVRRRVDLDAWVDVGENLIDRRTSGPFRGTGGLRAAAEESLLSVWEEGDGEAAAAAIQQFSETYSPALREHGRRSQTNEALYREWERGIARWLYSVEHIDVSYSLEYDGLNVERLSPGSRGIVLLLLYLAVDQSDVDPLIIDQPEENLDPKSVYSELVELFQSASERRQIIMVTHNANLVVNTDVDQVVVASCESLEEGRLPQLSYQAGGLEEPFIRRAVCDVLEGGAEAFRQRARRLHMDFPADPADEG